MRYPSVHSGLHVRAHVKLHSCADAKQARQREAQQILACIGASPTVVAIVEQVDALAIATGLTSHATDALTFAQPVLTRLAGLARLAAHTAVARIVLIVATDRAAADLTGFTRDPRGTTFALATFADLALLTGHTAATAVLRIRSDVVTAIAAARRTGGARRNPSTTEANAVAVVARFSCPTALTAPAAVVRAGCDVDAGLSAAADRRWVFALHRGTCW